MFSPGMVICAGFSGGAVEGLATGDVVVGNRTFAVEGPPDAWTRDGARSIETEQSALDGIRDALADSGAKYAVASCLTAPAFVSDPAVKRRLGGEFGVSAIDMESYWAVEEASRLGVPCVPVRVVLDPVGQRVSRLVGDTLGDAPVAPGVQVGGVSGGASGRGAGAFAAARAGEAGWQVSQRFTDAAST